MTLCRIALVVALSTGCASVGHEARAPEGAERVASSSLDSPSPAAATTATVPAAAATGAGARLETAAGPTAAEARAGTPGAPANAARPSGEALRHFYLLSPGPNATLVVTRSDLAIP